MTNAKRIQRRSKTYVGFAAFRDFLSDLGFRLIVLSEDHIAFQHDTGDTLLALPAYEPNQHVAPHHPAVFRAQLDEKGIPEADEFERLAASAGLQQTAS
ncbi:MAG TPA: hypothetical protein PLF81_01995 [Candidatus Anammoximicrobium sp.]|nr:hypothetical protein [Candidatus Anammoximicrobium sp.]